MTLFAGFTDLDGVVLNVADLSNRRLAVKTDNADFSRRKPHLCHTVFLGHQLRRAARAADKLTALAGIQFNVVNKRTDRNVGDRKRVSRLDIRIRRRINRYRRR